jgi:hypothetical protein
MRATGWDARVPGGLKVASTTETAPDVTQPRERWQSRHAKPCRFDHGTVPTFSLTLPNLQRNKTNVWRLGKDDRQQVPANGLTFDAKPRRHRVERMSAGREVGRAMAATRGQVLPTNLSGLVSGVVVE